MAVETPYHRLPEDNRPSMDSLLPGDDQGLLDTDSLYDEDSPPKKGHNLKISYHPTFYIRLLVLCLCICAFAVLIASKHGKAIPATVFLGFAILRQITVLYFHLIGHCFIRIRVEIVGRKASTRNSKPKGGHPDWLKQRRIQFAIDWLIIISLIITSCIAQINEDRGWYSFRSRLVMPGCIICWVAIPLHALSSVDLGKPNRITFSNAVSFDMSRVEYGDDTTPPRVYRDVEASGGVHGDIMRKTSADSPPMVPRASMS